MLRLTFQILLATVASMSAAQFLEHGVCAGVLCQVGYRCEPAPKHCITTPCPQYRCKPILPPCAGTGNMCPDGQRCVPEPKHCVSTPCPQYRCEPQGPDSCTPNPCPVGQSCVAEPKQCKTTPCPQYRCEEPHPECGPNAEWTQCGTACPATCDGQPDFCVELCVVGCQCKDGYVIDSEGRCIEESECPLVVDPCAPNPCPDGQSCVAEPKLCFTTPCPQYKCEEPQPECGPNAEWTQCGTACPATCDGQIGFCTQQCVVGCQCKDGYVIDSEGRCIQESECPQDDDPCAPNPCPDGQSCVAEPKLCVTTPCPRYRCQEPQPECGPNAEWAQCGTACPATCDGQPMICTEQCIIGCQCLDGFVLDSDGRCILESECPPPMFDDDID